MLEEAALKPSGAMPENADEKSEADSEADRSDRQWTARARAKEKPAKRGLISTSAPLLHSEQSGGMGDTECESADDSLENTSISKPGDALSDVIARDATLCELVLLWSSLDANARSAISAIVRSRVSAD